VRFSEPVEASTVAGAVSVSDASGTVAGSVAVAAGDTATWTASSALPSGTYLLQVSQTVTDLAGNALAFPYSQIFSDAAEETFFSGTVIDDATGRPLAGARVVVTATGGVATAEPQPEQTAVAGEVLGSSPALLGGEVTAAAVSFDPEIVLPTQTMRNLPHSGTILDQWRTYVKTGELP